MKQNIAIGLAVLVLLSGCSFNQSVQTKPTATNSTVTNSIETSYAANEIKLETILISLSDLPRAYSPAGESQSNGSSEPNSVDIQQKYERAFKLNNTANASTYPIYIITGVMLYDDSTGADRGKMDIIPTNYSYKRPFSIASGDKATICVFQTDNGLKATLAVAKQKNLVYYNIIVDDSPNQEFTKKLITKMYSGLPPQ